MRTRTSKVRKNIFGPDDHHHCRYAWLQVVGSAAQNCDVRSICVEKEHLVRNLIIRSTFTATGEEFCHHHRLLLPVRSRPRHRRLSRRLLGMLPPDAPPLGIPSLYGDATLVSVAADVMDIDTIMPHRGECDGVCGRKFRRISILMMSALPTHCGSRERSTGSTWCNATRCQVRTSWLRFSTARTPRARRSVE